MAEVSKKLAIKTQVENALDLREHFRMKLSQLLLHKAIVLLQRLLILLI